MAPPPTSVRARNSPSSRRQKVHVTAVRSPTTTARSMREWGRQVRDSAACRCATALAPASAAKCVHDATCINREHHRASRCRPATRRRTRAPSAALPLAASATRDAALERGGTDFAAADQDRSDDVGETLDLGRSLGLRQRSPPSAWRRSPGPVPSSVPPGNPTSTLSPAKVISVERAQRQRRRWR